MLFEPGWMSVMSNIIGSHGSLDVMSHVWMYRTRNIWELL